MATPWDIYDQLIDQIPADITVQSARADGKWRRIGTSEGGAGMAFGMNVQSRPRAVAAAEDLVGCPLRDAASLVKSWNFEDAGLGMAAINAYHCHTDRALAHGFTPLAENNWARTFHAYADAVAGKRVAIVGHFPFAPAALPDVAELIVLERALFDGDYPDSACEYLLPGVDWAFITGSAFVNKTMPRLLELTRGVRSVVLGPSAPASPIVLDHGASEVLAFASCHPALLEEGLAGRLPGGMFDAGMRVGLARG